jgi:phosphotransacetylase/acyl dehydratase
LRSFTNITYDELEVGASATVSRRISQTEVDALALVSGDVDAFHLVGGGTGIVGATTAKAVGGEAIISGLLSRRMPGPGTTLLSQQLNFSGAIAAGDELSASATVLEKRPDHVVVLACNVKRGDEELVGGTVVVRAPTQRISYSDVATPEMVLRRNDAYTKLLRHCEGLPPVRCAVVHPCDRGSLLGALEAAHRNLIVPILVGPEQKIRAVAEAEGADLTGFTIVSTEHSHESATRAVQLARQGKVEALMKGSLHTDEMLAAIVPSSTGLRTARRISHVFILDVPAYPRPLLVTDAAINIQPTLEDKVDIVQNAIELAHVLGIEIPRVAILSAVETVNPKIPSTVDAAALCKMADRGQITGGLLDGPLAFDNAISLEAARTKKIRSDVAGRADILVVPDLESGNMLAKQLQYLAGADSAGIVLGTRVPIVLTSRSDTVRTRLASTAIMALVANARRKGLSPAIAPSTAGALP